MTEVLKRVPVVPRKELQAYWCNPFTGEYLAPDGTYGFIPEPMHITDILNWIASPYPRMTEPYKIWLYLMSGTLNEKRPELAFFDSRGSQWERSFFEWKKLTGSYWNDKLCIELFGTGEYWGDDTEVSVLDLRAAKMTLEHMLANAFSDVCFMGRDKGPFRFTLRYTPSSTGRDLLAGSLTQGQAYPALPHDIAVWLTHFGQARIETLAPAIPVVTDGVYIIDAVWFYASCADSLPLGEPLHDKQNIQALRKDATGHIYPAYPGFYQVLVRVPDGWNHIGLVKDYEASNTLGHSVYTNKPGETFTAYITSEELAMLAQYNWKYRIVERVVFPDTAKYLQPLTLWNHKLVELRKQAETSRYATLLKNAIRSIHLHTIGSLARVYDYIYHETPFDELPLPDSVVIAQNRDYEDYERELYCWSEEVPLSPKRRSFCKPEWSYYTWSVARRRLTEFALKLPYKDIIYLNTDGIWCVNIPPFLDEKEQYNIGEFRLKYHIPGPWSWPLTSQSMRAIVLDLNERKRNEPS